MLQMLFRFMHHNSRPIYIYIESSSNENHSPVENLWTNSNHPSARYDGCNIYENNLIFFFFLFFFIFILCSILACSCRFSFYVLFLLPVADLTMTYSYGSFPN